VEFVLKLTEQEYQDFATNRLILSKVQEVLDRLGNLEESVDALTVAVTEVADRVGALVEPLRVALAEAQTALQAERDQAAALAVAEDAEDVQQNADLATARDATDAALANASAAADEINVEVDRLNAIVPPE
jgi:type II secretory pathway component PulM